MSSEKKVAAPAVRLSRHLLLNTFGPAQLEYRGRTVANSKIPSHESYATSDFMFRIFVNPDESIDIQRNPANPKYRLQIFNNGHRAAVLMVTENDVEVDANYTTTVAAVVQRPLRKLDTARNYDEQINLDLLTLTLEDPLLIRRVDYRYRNALWVTLFMHQQYLLTVRPNGDYFSEAIRSLMYATGRKYHQHKLENHAQPIDFGLEPAQRRLPGMPSSTLAADLPSGRISAPSVQSQVVSPETAGPNSPSTTPPFKEQAASLASPLSTGPSTGPSIRMPIAPLATDLPSPSHGWMQLGTVSSETGARSRTTQVAQSNAAHDSSSENSSVEADSDDEKKSRASLMEDTQKMLQQLTNTLKILNEADGKKKQKKRK